MGLSRHGAPFVVGSIVFLLASTALSREWPAWPRIGLLVAAASLLIVFLIFFRDPRRVPPPGDRMILAPADGRIVRIAEETDDALPGETRILISIFMSLWNVHVNRAPITGLVIRKIYRPGKFLPAFRHEASRSNENCSLIIEQDGRSILLRQISGLIARRIVTYPEEGDRLERGERLGMILFGSRLDVFVPSDCRIQVRAGEKTVAGRTVLGEF